MRALLDGMASRDPDLARIEAAAGPLPWRVRPTGFPGLLHAIVAQQISAQAAAAIWHRLSSVDGALGPLQLLDLSDEALRGAGLSRPKILHARALAAAFVDGRLAAGSLAELEDEAAITVIASVRGMGRWSAEVYLLFALARLDVFPAGDLALAGAVANLQHLPARPGPAALRLIAERWRPHRSLAARLLFHHWRYVTGRSAGDVLPTG